MSQKVPYRIETDRLVIRCSELTDANMLLDAITKSLDHLRPWMRWARNEPETLDKKIEFLRKTRSEFDADLDYTYRIFNREEDVMLGSTGLHTRVKGNAREIGYWVHADHINKGIATETVMALTKVGFEVIGLDRIEIHIDPRNEASLAIPQKLGYQLEATLKKRVRDPKGEARDTMIWTMFEADYRNTPSSKIEVKAFDAIGRLMGVS